MRRITFTLTLAASVLAFAQAESGASNAPASSGSNQAPAQAPAASGSAGSAASSGSSGSSMQQNERSTAPAKPAEASEGGEAAASKGGSVSVVDAKLATEIKDREPQGEANTFKTGVGKVYCWTKVTGTEGSEVTHAWYKGDEKMGEVKLNLKYPTMRTWSSKTIPADGQGDWRVDVVGPDGTVLKSLSFKVEG